METDLFSKSEFELTRSTCGKLIFTTHRIIHKDEHGGAIRSTDLQDIKAIHRVAKRNPWFFAGSVGALFVLAGTYMTSGLAWSTLVVFLTAITTIILYCVSQSESITIKLENGEKILVKANCIRIESQSLINAIESARFDRFNTSFQSAKVPKRETKVVKIPAYA